LLRFFARGTLVTDHVPRGELSSEIKKELAHEPENKGLRNLFLTRPIETAPARGGACAGAVGALDETGLTRG
jgi:hypothetical protein